MGLYVWGHEVRSFRPCHDVRELWVVDETGELRGAWDAAGLAAYEPLLVEVEGRLEPTPTEGFGANYDGQLRVRRVVRAGETGDRCPREQGV